MSNQPVWKLLAQLGDVNPLDYGGFWIFQDTTGVYAPEGEILFPPDSDERGEKYLVYRFSLEKCTLTDGILSDNKFHPLHPAWFAKPESERATRPQDTTYLSNVANCIGDTLENLQSALCSDDIVARAYAYRSIGEYHGFDNLDSYPLEMSRREAKQRYAQPQYREIKQ